jgi:hypothetical protein
MAKQLVVKIMYENEPRKITATATKEQRGRLIAYNGKEKVADFPSDRIEYWALEDDIKK